jgi:competence protein ComEC
MAREDTLLESMPKQALNRHWVWIALWYAAGIFWAHRLPWAVWLLGPLFGLAGAAVLVFPLRMPRRSHWGIALLCLGLGMTLYGLRMPKSTPDTLGQYALSYPRGRHAFEGVVKKSAIHIAGDEYTTFTLQVDRAFKGAETVPILGRAVVRWSRPDRPVFAGTRVRVTGRLSPHLGTVNHGVRGFEDYYRARGVYSEMRASGDAVTLLALPRYSPRYWAARLRQGQHEVLSRVIPESVYPFVLGVWLGEQSHINREVYAQFLYAGTAHVLSVSGVHVAIITISLGLLLQVLGVPRRLRNVLLMAGVLAFTMMTGAQTATVRSAMMICMYLSAELFNRESDALSVLGLSGCAFLAWNPALLFDTSFLLSFGSVASILLYYPGLSRAMSVCPPVIRAPITTTLAAQMVTIPIAAWHFNLISLLGVMANLAVVPLLTAVLWLCFLCGLLGAVFPGIAILFGHAMLVVVRVIEWTNAAASWVPGAYASVNRPSLPAVLFYAAAVCLLFPLLYDPQYRKRNAILAVAFLAVSLLLWNPLWKHPVVDFIDVGTGDSIFIRTPGGTTLLVDGGDTSEYVDAGERVVTPFLYANRVKALDYVVVTHPDRDHIGGLFTVLKHIRVGAVLLGPEGKAPVALETDFIAQCEHRGIPVHRLERGNRIPVEGAEIQVLHPSHDWAARNTGNNTSLVLHVSWPGLSLLLPGDVEEEAERELLPFMAQPAVLLKAPHHGSPTSSSKAFLEKVNPALAVASMQAEGSRQTLMTPAMVRRYADHGITLFRTDWHGGVRIQPTRKGLQVHTARGTRGYCLKPVSLSGNRP